MSLNSWAAACRISIHALRVEGDQTIQQNVMDLPAYFYPRPPGGGRRQNLFFRHSSIDFYPRPPGGGRHLQAIDPFVIIRFLSTPSGWRATICRSRPICIKNHFYPRPPGGGRRSQEMGTPPAPSKFLSTPSGWRATPFDLLFVLAYIFLSTPSGWRATIQGVLVCCGVRISIHALRVEGDNRE